ncbi:hypothetical protein HYV74_04255 [Candidatus Uhrbacteria bacterium]|nr:hypothetical protein [Candidatus Uhrbacteria bacterium]
MGEQDTSERSGSRSGIGKTVLGWFVQTDPSGPSDPAEVAPTDSGQAADAIPASLRKDVQPTVPAGAPVESPPVPSTPPIDVEVNLDSIYAEQGLASNPDAERILGAIEGMQGIDASARRAAVVAMVRAFAVDASTLRATLMDRTSALDATITDCERVAESGRTERARSLAALTASTQQEIAALQEEIAQKERTLEGTRTMMQRTEAAEQEKLDGLRAKLGAERDRLTALMEYLPMTGSSPKEGLKP